MLNYNLVFRANLYHEVFPNYPRVVVDKDWLYGIWLIGYNYKSKHGYYGEYPPTYLKRVHSLFSDATNVLHLFSGSVEKGMWKKETLFDINGEMKPDVVGEASKLSSYFNEKFDLILADPPYSNDDAEHYGTPMISRNIVVKEACKLLEPGGYLCWLDQVLPMFSKDNIKYVGTIGIVRSTNHRFRILSIFRKLTTAPKEEQTKPIDSFF